MTMMQNTELTHAAVNELEQRLLDTHQAREAAMLAASMTEAIAIQELTKSGHSVWRAAQQKDPNTYISIAPFITPLLAVLGVQQPTPLSDEAPKSRVPVLDGGEPVKRTRKRKPTVSGVVKQVTKAGVEVARIEVDPSSGKISVVAGKPGEATTPDDNNNSNEWNGVL
jgi:hypothetical protein